ncbi:MAG: NAD-dependent epimerase/dehydratase family protein [Candidatus Saccharicenans sp.]|nr:NAD-dependent epimerase/dehydratase family protein [Candidatus Aminicenantes bacterium]
MISLVTGATGFVGSHLIDYLLAQDKGEVFALVRNPAKTSWLKARPNFHILLGDLQSLPPLPSNLEVVFHLAGLTKATKPDDYYTVNWLGTASLLENLTRKNLQPKFIQLSSLAAGRPAINGQPVKEEEPPSPASPYGRSKLLAEQEVLKYKDKMPVVILRAAAIYGPRDKDFLQFFQLVNRGWLLTFSQKIVMSLCYVNDLIQAIRLCTVTPTKSGEIYNVADPVPRTWEDLGEEAARLLGRKIKKIKIPLSIVKTAAGLSELSSRITGKASPINLSKYRDMEKLSWVADTTKIKQELGFETRWPFEQGLKETLIWYQENGWL